MPTTPPRSERRSPWALLGVAGAACVACCAGPVLAALAATGVFATGLAWLLWPAAGLVVAATTLVVLAAVRRRRHVTAARVTLSGPPRAPSGETAAR